MILNDSLKESKKSQFDDIPNNRIDKNIEIQNAKNSIELNKNTTSLNLILPVGSSTIQMDSKNQQKNCEIYPNNAISKINIKLLYFYLILYYFSHSEFQYFCQFYYLECHQIEIFYFLSKNHLKLNY